MKTKTTFFYVKIFRWTQLMIKMRKNGENLPTAKNFVKIRPF